MSKRIPIFIGLLFLALFVWLSLTPFPPVRYVFSRIDNIFYDIQIKLHLWMHPQKAQGPVIIVDIDDESLKKYGRWPWSRSLMGQLVDQLKQLGVVVVATDMMFSEPESNIVSTILDTLNTKKLATPVLTTALNQLLPDFDQDAIFAHSMAGTDVILGMVFLPSSQTGGLLAPPLLTLSPQQARELSLLSGDGFIGDIPVLQQAAKGTGFLNIVPDIDGIVRRAPVVMRYQDKVYPSLALAAAQRYLLMNNLELVTPYYGDTVRLEGIKFGNYTIPTDEKGQVLIPFIGNSFTFPFISADKILSGQMASSNEFAGKLAIIGTSATGIGDLKPTSLTKIFPGVEIQASIVNGILTHYFPYRPAWATGAELVCTVLIGLLAAIIFPYLGPVMVAVLIASLPIVFTIFWMIEEWIWYTTANISFFGFHHHTHK